MSHAKITLRPPPNVDYVQGFPGIPPNAPDRPQAAVRGTIELRLGSEPVKAKWVRIELRKVETLPGGGQANTFYDHVGQSPLNVWQAREDYDLLQTQDFPFYIRIPESVPPSINLEKGASIHYELVASVCLKGKKGLLRRSTSVTLSTTAPVIIDKHELHSTWPIYAQSDTRHVAHDALFLTVDRTHTCYGPGDRVTCTATLRSDSISTVVLRAFELSLKETTVWRGNPHSKKGSPQVSMQVVGEEKQAVNATLYGGTQHKTELSCVIPSHHCVSTVTAARHIDVTYTLHIAAVMASGQPLMLTLPVIVTNWTRHVSIEAVRRIGLAPSLSPGVTAHQSQVAQGSGTFPPAQSYDSAQSQTSIHEFGGDDGITAPYNTMPSRTTSNDFAPMLSEQRSQTVGSAAGVRPGTSGSVRPSTGGSEVGPNLGRRIDSIQEEGGGASTSPNGGGRSWLSSEDEKRKLYQRAKADVERVQGVRLPTEETPRTDAPKETKKKSKTPWVTSEEEKKKLYDRAQAQVRKTQARAALQNGAGSSGKHSKNNSINSLSPPSVDGHNKPSTSQAFPGANRDGQAGVGAGAGANGSDADPNMVTPTPVRVTSPKPAHSFPTAEEEKARLRYEEAKQAVARNQPSAFAGDTHTGAPSSSQTAAYDAPPPGGFVAPGQYEQAYTEKERLRRAYAEQDAVAIAESSSSYSRATPEYHSGQGAQSSGSTSNAPLSFVPQAGVPNMQLLSEKDQLRRLYEAQDAATLVGPSASGSPPSTTAPSQLRSSPAIGDSQAFLEKERLRRWYEQQDALASSLPAQPMSPASTASHVNNTVPVVPFSSTPPSDIRAAAEKERLRRWYEQQDAVAATKVSSSSASSSYNQPAAESSSSAVSAFRPSRGPSPPIDEKERLRQWYERQDALARGQASVTRSISTTSTSALHYDASSSRLPPMSPKMSTAPLRPLSTRPQPTPPVIFGGHPSMSTAKEDAGVQSRYDEDPSSSFVPLRTPSTTPSLRRDPTIREGKQRANGAEPSTPPPLMPRPPDHYINETKQADERLRTLSMYENVAVPLEKDNGGGQPAILPSISRSSSMSPSLTSYTHVPPPPPLPPKIPIN